jgi:archaellum biogenesis ATPase FlaH
VVVKNYKTCMQVNKMLQLEVNFNMLNVGHNNPAPLLRRLTRETRRLKQRRRVVLITSFVAAYSDSYVQSFFF